MMGGLGSALFRELMVNYEGRTRLIEVRFSSSLMRSVRIYCYWVGA